MRQRRITDNTSCVSSVHAIVSRALLVRMPIKPRKLNVPAPQMNVVQSTSAIAPQTSVTQFTPITAEQVIAEPRQCTKRKLTSNTTQKPNNLLRSDEKLPLNHRAGRIIGFNRDMPPTFSSIKAPSRRKRRQTLKQKQIENSHLNHPESCSTKPWSISFGISITNSLSVSTLCNQELCLAELWGYDSKRIEREGGRMCDRFWIRIIKTFKTHWKTLSYYM